MKKGPALIWNGSRRSIEPKLQMKCFYIMMWSSICTKHNTLLELANWGPLHCIGRRMSISACPDWLPRSVQSTWAARQTRTRSSNNPLCHVCNLVQWIHQALGTIDYKATLKQMTNHHIQSLTCLEHLDDHLLLTWQTIKLCSTMDSNIVWEILNWLKITVISYNHCNRKIAHIIEATDFYNCVINVIISIIHFKEIIYWWAFPIQLSTRMQTLKTELWLIKSTQSENIESLKLIYYL